MGRPWKFKIAAGLIASLIYDYVSYHGNLESAGSAVTRFGGRSGYLMDWPFGRELRITFDRPLNAEELRELAVLNSLSSRHWVGVAFDCQIEMPQLDAAHDALPDCVVFAVDPETGDIVWPANNARAAESSVGSH